MDPSGAMSLPATLAVTTPVHYHQRQRSSSPHYPSWAQDQPPPFSSTAPPAESGPGRLYRTLDTPESFTSRPKESGPGRSYRTLDTPKPQVPPPAYTPPQPFSIIGGDPDLGPPSLTPGGRQSTPTSSARPSAEAVMTATLPSSFATATATSTVKIEAFEANREARRRRRRTWQSAICVMAILCCLIAIPATVAAIVVSRIASAKSAPKPPFT